MPPTRVNGNGDAAAAGRGRQRLKFAGIGYAASRHGVDATVELTQAARKLLRQYALEYVAALPGDLLRNRRIDLAIAGRQGDDEMLCIAAIAYASARHGVDGDVGMAREGIALLSQAAIDFSETVPREEPSTKRSSSPHLHLGNGSGA
jgi:hypothetical protein